MKHLKINGFPARDFQWGRRLVLLLFVYNQSFGQSTDGWKLDRMPVDLEMEFALSALPPHLRDSATVYLLNPEKGYYIARKGTNGFSTYLNRTEWERAEFVQDTYSAISYDPEGVKTYLPVAFAVAEMRSSGKYNPLQIRDTIVKRVKDGTYKAPSRTGVSYMLGPLMRTHDQDGRIVTMIMPHYMFYSPRVDNSDIGGVWDAHSPYAINSGDILEKQHSIFNFIILPAGDTEKAAIMANNKDLCRRLGEYKSYFKIEQGATSHQH